LCSLPIYFEHFKDDLFYKKEGTITLDEFQSTLRTIKLTKFKDLKVEDSGEGLKVSREIIGCERLE